MKFPGLLRSARVSVPARLQRLSETFTELLDCPMSQGTVANIVKSGHPIAYLSIHFRTCERVGIPGITSKTFPSPSVITDEGSTGFSTARAAARN